MPAGGGEDQVRLALRLRQLGQPALHLAVLGDAERPVLEPGDRRISTRRLAGPRTGPVMRGSAPAVLHLRATAAAVPGRPLGLPGLGEVLEVAPGGDPGGPDRLGHLGRRQRASAASRSAAVTSRSVSALIPLGSAAGRRARSEPKSWSTSSWTTSSGGGGEPGAVGGVLLELGAERRRT